MSTFLGTPFNVRSPRPASRWRGLFQGRPSGCRYGPYAEGPSRRRSLEASILSIVWVLAMVPPAMGSHKGAEEHQVNSAIAMEESEGHAIPGAPFQVFLQEETGRGKEGSQTRAKTDVVLQTVIEAFNHMMAHRTEYARFDEALTKDALQNVIIEPKVVNREGKEFLLLVARTSQPNQVNLLISASALEEEGYLNHPEQLVPVLAREFQWVVSKADTTPKRQMNVVRADLARAPILTNQEIAKLSGEEREQVLQELFRTYLITVDQYASLEGQSYYETGFITLIPPDQPDSTTKLYDIRVRAALQTIVREPYFQEHTPKAVRSLLNGKIWNVAFANIKNRDWATRTRVVPKDQSVTVGESSRTIQPAMILINIYRPASPDDSFYSETNGLPMGALPVEKLARVIAEEIQNNITEKSMRGHVAQDELTAPQ